MVEVNLSIPYPYNPGEWRISKQVVGPRGGKHFETVLSQSATGGEYCTNLNPGIYKETYWSNGWAHCNTFEINESGEVITHG